MRVCLIPPRGLEDCALRSNRHLVLAQITNRYYQDTYKKLRSLPEHWMTVDNGANEGTAVGDFKLMEVAAEYHAHEVVVPDVLYDADKTKERVKGFFRNLEEMHDSFYPKPMGFMGVVQGTNSRALQDMIEFYAEQPKITALGIPRHLIKTMKDSTIRLKLAEQIWKRWGDARPVHLLGTCASYLEEIVIAGKMGPIVRSVDSSLPFNYALHGTKLQLGAPEINRPVDYFTKYFGAPLRHTFLDENIAMMQKWASGRR
jgi:hypothetical protein